MVTTDKGCAPVKKVEMVKEVQTKFVFEYDSGGYYEWRGESRSYAVKHVTKSLYDAHKWEEDSESVIDSEPQGNCGPGKYVKVKITVEIEVKQEEPAYAI